MTDTYIEMCDCEEVQGLWEQREADRCIPGAGENNVVQFLPSPPHKYLEADYMRENFIWLPRQEDIQEMFVSAGRNEMPQLIARLYAWVNAGKLDYGKPTPSGDMDKYWLAFYMSEVQNKRWTNEGWV